ncbi:MAG: 5'/3'-nucleotidase SurE [Spirochaetales bacterium]|jgi:5'-nucleotidase|nr:5'/3'-nucleotidase SurE [Spirochaetales bacterium]
MRVVLTNDDGVGSAGLDALRREIEAEHEVWIFAPDGERSGTSHRITLNSPVMKKKLDERVYSCSGSPADCVLLSVLGALPFRPDMVVSGINIGPNIGTDIVYSGTAAAARQAALMGIPSLAVSLNAVEEPFHFEPLARFVARNLEEFVSLWDDLHFVNINAPNSMVYAGTSITLPSRRRYRDKLEELRLPDGNTCYYLHGPPPDTDEDPRSDWEALMRNRVSISPVQLQPVSREEDERYHKARFTL